MQVCMYVCMYVCLDGDSVGMVNILRGVISKNLTNNTRSLHTSCKMIMKVINKMQLYRLIYYS